VKAFFAVAVISEVGNGERTLFWADRWLHGQCIAELAPRLFAVISKRRIKQRRVKEALNNRAWIADIHGAITVEVLLDVFQLWDILSGIVLQPEREDTHIWRLSSNGQYSAKAAYEGFFLGASFFAPWERIWKTWAPPKCQFFMWLVAHNKCWTSDRLARHGMPHPDCCPLCDQEEESINHLLVECVFTREFWFILLRQVGLQALSPQPTDNSFLDWWERANNATSDLVRQGVGSLIILGAWTLWNHCNCSVFYGAAPSMARALMVAGEERWLWTTAGARGLSLLSAHLPGD